MSEPLFPNPLIEGRMNRGVTMPVFIKALTQGSRLVELPPDFASRPDHLERAAEVVREHFYQYKFHESMPLAYYAYIIVPGNSYRFSTAGRLLGEFYDHPIVAYMQTKNGKKFSFGD